MKTPRGFVTLSVFTGIIVVLALGSIWYFGIYKGGSMAQDTQNQTSQTKIFGWDLSDVTEGEYATPHTNVVLVFDGTRYEVGTNVGRCTEFGPGEEDFFGEQAAHNELSPRILCYWGGGGYEFGVFKEGSKYVVKKALVDEGGYGIPGGKDDFESVMEVQ